VWRLTDTRAAARVPAQLLSGDTWSLKKMQLSLKNVRERLMGALAEKGVLHQVCV
jgi:hypothetical protein